TLYRDEIVGNGGRPNGDGQFFLGQAIRDPGPLFYIVADVLRTTPATLLGLLALPLAFRRPTTDDRRPPPKERTRWSVVGGRWSGEQRVLLALAAFVLFWTLVMTLGPKKFDRYVLPTWPALCVLAAMGLVALFKVGTLERWNMRVGLVGLLAL